MPGRETGPGSTLRAVTGHGGPDRGQTALKARANYKHEKKKSKKSQQSSFKNPPLLSRIS